MHAFSLVAGAVVLLGLLVVFGRILGGIYFKARGERVITCPENLRPAGVTLNTRHVVWTTLEGKPDLQLASCSRWPERHDCGQQCLHQIETAPDACLVRNILTHWYAGKVCTLCRNPFGAIQWNDHKPALLTPEHRTLEWQDVPAASIPAVLATHQPVCWNCHVFNRMRIEHPDLLVDRSRKT